MSQIHANCESRHKHAVVVTKCIAFAATNRPAVWRLTHSLGMKAMLRAKQQKAQAHTILHDPNNRIGAPKAAVTGLFGRLVCPAGSVATCWIFYHNRCTSES